MAIGETCAARAVVLAATMLAALLAGCGEDGSSGGAAGAGAGTGAAGAGATGTGAGGGDAGSGAAAGGVQSSIIPADRRIDWKPGVPGGIGDVSQVCPANAPSVTDFGAVGDGVADDYPAFAAAVAAAVEPGAIRVPAGTYLLGSGLVIDKGVVLCGEGPASSRLVLDADAAGIEIDKYDRGDWVAVAPAPTKGSTTLQVADASSFVVGQYAELVQANDWNLMDPDNIWRNDAWVPEDAVGQMLAVLAVDGNTLTVDPAVHLDYLAADSPRVRRVALVQGAGLQGLFLQRLATFDWPTVIIKNAVASWMRDCESQDTSVAHVVLEEVLWCEIRDSYFHHSFSYGGGGHGYGTDLGSHVTAALVENNIFVHLRHAMLTQVGATGNVLAYNYSIEPYQDDGTDWTPPDISLHGHYANMNLFEGNSVQEVDVSDYWGASGPGNTLFRLRVQAEGIDVLDYSHRQNVVGNELGTGLDVITIDPTVQDTLVHGNYVDGAVAWDPTIPDHVLPPSLYLTSKPAFFGDTPWPLTGADLAPSSGALPAEQRYQAR